VAAERHDSVTTVIGKGEATAESPLFCAPCAHSRAKEVRADWAPNSLAHPSFTPPTVTHLHIFVLVKSEELELGNLPSRLHALGRSAPKLGGYG